MTEHYLGNRTSRVALDPRGAQHVSSRQPAGQFGDIFTEKRLPGFLGRLFTHYPGIFNMTVSILRRRTAAKT